MDFTDKPKHLVSPTPSFENFSESCPTGKPDRDLLCKAMPRNLLLTPEIEKTSITTEEGSKEWEKKKKFYEFILGEKKSLKRNESKSLCGELENGAFKELEEGFKSETRRQSVSFGAARVELADIFAGNGVKIVAVDMPPFMQIHAVNCARKTRDAMAKFTSKALASTLKKEFDEVYGPAWHCIVGSSFGSFVTHSVGGFLYFSMDQKLYVLLFKTAVQRAD